MPPLDPVCLRVICVLVVYEVQRDPRPAVANLLPSVHHVIVVDNAPGGHPLLSTIAPSERLTVIRNDNVDALAGAYNAAIEHIEWNLLGATHLLYLDDDTDTQTVPALLNSPATLCALARPEVAAVAPVALERETGLRGGYIQLGRFSFKILPRDLAEPVNVSFLINSMSLWSLAAVRRIGLYNRQLKIDRLDTDYCLRAALLGYTMVLNPDITFIHSIGNRQAYRLLGWTLQTGGHSAQRRRLIAANTVLLGKHYLLRFPSFAILSLLFLVYEVVGIAVAEPDRLAKLGALARGVWDGVFGRYEQAPSVTSTGRPVGSGRAT